MNSEGITRKVETARARNGLPVVLMVWLVMGDADVVVYRGLVGEDVAR